MSILFSSARPVARPGELLLFTLIGALSFSVDAATFTVTSTADAPDQNLDNGLCDALVAGQTECTLRAALMQAASNDIVELPSGTYVVSRPRNASQPDSSVGDLDIHARTIEVRGPFGGPRPVIVADPGFDDSLFAVATGGCPIGGGICPGRLRLRRLVLDGADDLPGYGAAITCGAAHVELEDVLLQNSGVQFRGGALSASNCTVSLTRVEFRGNRAGQRGGAIALESSGMTADTLSLIDNEANIGGGALYHNQSGITLHNATLFNNRAPKGAATWSYGATLTAVNMTLTGNTGLSGGDSESAMLFQAGTFRPANSIWAQNDVSIADVALSGQLQSDGYNMAGSIDYSPATSIVTLAGSDVLNPAPLNLLGPMLAPWSIAGVRTLPPAVGSPVIDVGHPGGSGVACRPVDANGVIRVGPCDIGAAELPDPALLDFIFVDGFEL